MGKYSTRMGTRVGSVSRSDPRKPSFGTKVSVSLVCGHVTFFRAKVKPKQGEIIWCPPCADYQEVAKQ